MEPVRPPARGLGPGKSRCRLRLTRPSFDLPQVRGNGNSSLVRRRV